MPVSDNSELIRFALPKAQADKIREVMAAAGVKDPRPGVFFRDRVDLLLQAENINQRDGQVLAEVAVIKRDVDSVKDIIIRMAKFMQDYTVEQNNKMAESLQLIVERLDDLSNQVAISTFSAADIPELDKKKAGK